MKNPIILLGAVAALALFSSCSADFLETKPTNAVSTADIFATTDNALTALNGIHRSMYRQWEGTQNEGGLADLLLGLDYMCDDIVESSPSNGWFRSLYQWNGQGNPGSADVRFPWHMGYNTIANANMIIENIEQATGPENVKKEILAQSLTYRAYFNFLMVQLYGKSYNWTAKPNTQLGIPLRNTSGFEPIARNTVEEVYTQVFSDLNEAIKLFGEANIARSSKSHLNIYSANGIKARAALVTGQWQMAADAAKIVRTGSKTQLMTAAQLMNGNSSIDNPEWIWGSYQVPDQPLYFYSFYAYMSFNFNSSNIRGCPKCVNSTLYEKMSATDARRQWWEVNPTAANMADLTGPLPSNYTLAPYMNRKFRVEDRGSSIADYCYMRLSEMYLIEAEALARLNMLSEAQSVLTSFAITRDPSYTATATTSDQLINEVLIQRRIELWGEGFRFGDLKRTSTPLDRTNSNHLTIYCRILELPISDSKWQLQIPTTEVNSNPEIEQNPS